MNKKLQTGDIILVNSNGILAYLVSKITRRFSEKPTYCSHVAIMLDEKMVVEAKTNVIVTPFKKWKKNKQFEVWRKERLTSREKVLIFQHLYGYIGNSYGWWKLFFFFLDFIISKPFKHDIFFFRRLITDKKHPICSWLPAYVYSKINYYFGVTDPDYIDPDYMSDFIKAHQDDWTLIYKEGE